MRVAADTAAADRAATEVAMCSVLYFIPYSNLYSIPCSILYSTRSYILFFTLYFILYSILCSYST